MVHKWSCESSCCELTVVPENVLRSSSRTEQFGRMRLRLCYSRGSKDSNASSSTVFVKQTSRLGDSFSLKNPNVSVFNKELDILLILFARRTRPYCCNPFVLQVIVHIREDNSAVITKRSITGESFVGIC